MNELKRPILRYPGGKWRIAPWIISYFPRHRAYVEPFGGGASVLLRKKRSYLEVYNDRSGDVVNVFRVMRDPDKAERLRYLLIHTPYSRVEFNLAQDDEDVNDIEQARRILIRSYMGFGSTGIKKRNTGFRAKDCRKEGSSAAKQWMNFPDLIPHFTRRLNGVVIENRMAQDVMVHQDSPETLFYLDPPYVRSSRNDNADRYEYEMSDAEHRILSDLVFRLDGMVMISGYDCPLYRELYGEWRVVKKKTMAQSRVGGATRTECLWLSPNCELPQARMF